METLLRIGLSNAVVALLMALVVVTVACVWRRPAVLHALWLLVLVKLVTPPLIWVRIPWPIIPDSPPVAVVPTTEPAAVEPAPEGNATFVSDSEPTIETSAVETSVEPLESESVPPGEGGGGGGGPPAGGAVCRPLDGTVARPNGPISQVTGQPQLIVPGVILPTFASLGYLVIAVDPVVFVRADHWPRIPLRQAGTTC
jgi:hypothetical protein